MFNKKSNLDKALENILKIEKRREATVQAIEAARKELREKIAENLKSDSTSGETRLRATAAGHQAALVEIDKLLNEAYKAAKLACSEGADGRRAEIEKLEEKIKSVITTIDRRRLKAFAEFAKEQGVEIEKMPTEHNKGALAIPAVKIDPDEVHAIFETTTAEVIVDKDQDKLDSLRAEHNYLDTLAFTDPGTAVNLLLAERRRAAE